MFRQYRVILRELEIIRGPTGKIYSYKNTRLKLLKTKAAILFYKVCKTSNQYYQQLHLKYLCNLARY